MFSKYPKLYLDLRAFAMDILSDPGQFCGPSFMPREDYVLDVSYQSPACSTAIIDLLEHWCKHHDTDSCACPIALLPSTLGSSLIACSMLVM